MLLAKVSIRELVLDLLLQKEEPEKYMNGGRGGAEIRK